MTDPSAASLSEDLITRVVCELEALEAGPFHDWVLPSVYGAHRVGADVRADLLYTLAHLHAAGCDTVGGLPIVDIAIRVLAPIDGAATHTFFSYRVAEAVGHWGRFDDNVVLAALSAQARDQVAEATDSTSWLDLLDGGLPRNYAAVLARCEAARQALGLPVDAGILDGLIDRLRAMLGANTLGFLDDSEDGSAGRYDIYSADIYLFCEPLADSLGELWETGARRCVELVEHTMARNGAAITWGRSTGVLAVCLSIELAALATRAHLGDHRWHARAAHALHNLDQWFSAGVITAHQHRSPYGYRGPARRLQMTLDCLGKLAWSASTFALTAAEPSLAAAAHTDEGAFVDHDALTDFETDGTAALWSHRSPRNAFVVPLVGAPRSDYLSSPSNPGLYEVPVDRPLACWLPVVHVGEHTFTVTGRPSARSHRPGSLSAKWDRLGALTRPDLEPLEATTELRWEVQGRTLNLDATVRLDRDVDTIALTIPEAQGRPLHVELTSDQEHRTVEIDTAGIKEWRSFWGELPKLHETTFAPTRTLHWNAAVTPLIRVASEATHHHYHRSLYDPLHSHVVDHAFSRQHLDDADGGASRLRDVDLYHLHWPEWFAGTDVTLMERFCDLLDRLDIPLVWTQHNLRPHWDDPAFDTLYQLVAERAAAVIHHSSWGLERARVRYRYGAHCEHRVVPHGHFGNLLEGWDDARRAGARAQVEAELGLAPCSLRIGIVGAPRREKDVVGFMEAFARTTRDDLGLLVLSLRPEELEATPDDERIVALPYSFVDRDTYNRRLASLDVLALPFRADGDMLTTGVFADAVGLGVGALCTSWPFLVETLSDAALPIGDDVDAYAAALEALSIESVREAARAAEALRGTYEWARLGQLTYDLFDSLVPAP